MHSDCRDMMMSLPFIEIYLHMFPKYIANNEHIMPIHFADSYGNYIYGNKT